MANSLSSQSSDTRPAWRLLDTGIRTGAENMALDQILAEVRSEGGSPNTVRFLQFSPSVALVGRHQRIEQEVRVDFCREAGIEINRRVTGGGAILFDPPQLGWELIASSKELDVNAFSLSFQKKVISAAIRGLRALGVDAEFRPRNDIEVNGRKISGTGGMEEGDAFLFQGTLLMDFDIGAMVRALRIPTEKLKQSELDSAAERVTWLDRELGHKLPIEDVKAAIARGFEEEFGVRLEASGLTDEEQARFDERLSFYQSDEWIYGSRPKPSKVDTFTGFHRMENAVFVARAQVDTTRRRLRYVTIDGDFFIAPSRAMLDIEAALKDTRLDAETIRETIRKAWERGGVKANGFGPDDVFESLRCAIEKVELIERGFTAEETDSLFFVNGKPGEILDRECSLLLLPYCAKLPDCDYRHEEDCALCDLCDISDAFALGTDREVKVISICSFEHLIETLKKAKADGCQSYIGCCCEAFYRKHYDDFAESELPGVLIDISESTCYELKVEELAYLGKFENQTKLDLPLLDKVLGAVRAPSSK